MSDNTARFFEMCRERYKMLLRRRSRAEKYRDHPCPWRHAPSADGVCRCDECLLEHEGLLTRDPVLSKWRFCNVFREDDKTTVWFRENIREPLRNDPKVLLATVAFRWFNRIETGEKIKDILLSGRWDSKEVKRRLWLDEPVVTGAFMVKTPPGLDKLEGVCWCVEQFAKGADHLIGRWDPEVTLEGMWTALRTFPYLGPFMSYEVVTDLRHTHLLENAPDILSWANAGPGCARGLGRLVHDDADHWDSNSEKDQKEMLSEMKKLLDAARDEATGMWPKEWPQWEMREVEHGLCEFDKMMRGLGGSKLKRRYP